MSKKKPAFEFTTGQRELMDLVYNWYNKSNDEDFVYCGPAGTGKTSVLPYIIEDLGLTDSEVLYVAYTGKAATVLMQKGFPATTIHSAFFDLVEEPKKRDGRIITQNGRIVKELKFREKDFISPRIKLIVVDEWSMINESLANAIYKHGVPILASGDNHQLPPIFGKSPFEDKIQYELTEITRQASYSGIIQLATLIREGGELPIHKNFNNDAWVLSKDFLRDDHLLNADIVLTGTNRSRNDFNDRIRALHGSFGKLPNVGDKLICRKNCRNKVLCGIPLINGTLGKVLHPIRMDECNFSQKMYRVDFQPDYRWGSHDYYEALNCDYDFLTQPCGEKEIDEYNHHVKLEFAEAISVHLSQGSQYKNVVYYDEYRPDREYMRKLRYTAVTRATDKVVFFR